MAGRVLISEVTNTSLIKTRVLAALQHKASCFSLAETEADPELEEPMGRRGRTRVKTRVNQQQPKEDGVLQCGERRQGTRDGRRRVRRQAGGRGVPAGGGRGRDLQSCAHTR